MMRRIGLPLVLLWLLAGCAHLQTPDLHRLYASNRSVTDQPPVILIPGLMGSRIIDAQGNELWPGGIGKLLFSSYGDLALDIDPQTLAVDTRGATRSEERRGGKEGVSTGRSRWSASH